MSKRAVINVRVSTKEQAEKGYSIPSQLEACRKYAQEHGYTVVEETIDNCSGTIPVADRPGGSRVYELLRAGQVDAVIQYTLDRAARDDREYPLEYLLFLGDVQDNGAELHFVDSGRSDGGLIDLINAYQAGKEKRDIAERTRRGRRAIAKTGQIMGHGKSPYGFELFKEYGPKGNVINRELRIDEHQAHVVRQIFHWYVFGDNGSGPLSAYAIAQRLTDRQEPSWFDINGMGEKRAGYGQWSGQMVTRILRNTVYKGQWFYGKKSKKHGIRPKENWIEVSCVNIVDPETWRKAQARMERNKGFPNKTERPFLLQGGHAKCGLCGRPIHTYFYRYKSRKTGQVTEHRYYVCSSYRKKEHKCSLPYFKLAEVDNAIFEVIWKLQSDPVYLRERLTQLVTDWYTQTQGARERLATIDSMIEDHDRQLAKILDLYLYDDFPKEMLVERKERLEKTLAGLQSEKQKLAQVLEEPSWLVQTIQANTESALDGLAQVLAHMSSGKPLTIEANGQSKKFRWRFETDFQDKRKTIEELETSVTLTVENNTKVIYLNCLLGEEVIQLLDTTSRNGRVG
jgi:site-specific DNA recombinase